MIKHAQYSSSSSSSSSSSYSNEVTHENPSQPFPSNVVVEQLSTTHKTSALTNPQLLVSEAIESGLLKKSNPKEIEAACKALAKHHHDQTVKDYTVVPENFEVIQAQALQIEEERAFRKISAERQQQAALLQNANPVVPPQPVPNAAQTQEVAEENLSRATNILQQQFQEPDDAADEAPQLADVASSSQDEEQSNRPAEQPAVDVPTVAANAPADIEESKGPEQPARPAGSEQTLGPESFAGRKRLVKTSDRPTANEMIAAETIASMEPPKPKSKRTGGKKGATVDTPMTLRNAKQNSKKQATIAVKLQAVGTTVPATTMGDTDNSNSMVQSKRPRGNPVVAETPGNATMYEPIKDASFDSQDEHMD